MPLDLPRADAESLPWRPYSLADHVVSGQVGLLEVLADLRRGVLPHAARDGQPMPLLLDVNLWYRVQKLTYGREAQRWDVAAALRSMPPLYAVWHPYKQVVHALYERFRPYFHYVASGRLPEGRRWRSYPDLQTLERWLAAFLLLPEDRRARLRQAVAQYDRELAALVRALPDREADLARARAQHRTAEDRVRARLRDAEALAADRWPDPETRRRLQAERAAHDAVVRAEAAAERNREVPVLRGLADLVLEWAPACLLLGFYVRQCHWQYWGPGTAWQARDALVLALALLVRLEGWAERGRVTEYVRTLALALLAWTPWHDRLPACCFSEEPNEAALGRLGHLCERHTAAVDTSDVMDLYLLVQPPAPGVRRVLRPGNWGERWERESLARVDALLDHVLRRPAAGPVTDLVTYVRSAPMGGTGDRRELRADARWPDDWAPPPPPSVPAGDDADALCDLMRRALRSLVNDSPPTDEVARNLDDLAKPRPAEEVQRQWSVCDAIVPAPGAGGRRGAPRRSQHTPGCPVVRGWSLSARGQTGSGEGNVDDCLRMECAWRTARSFRCTGGRFVDGGHSASQGGSCARTRAGSELNTGATQAPVFDSDPARVCAQDGHTVDGSA